MRFYTVPDAKTARESVTYATAFIGFFYLLTFILGFGAMVLVGQDTIRAIDAGGNMAAPLLAEVVGGTPFLGFIAAVAFATILAVVAGLTLSGAAALSHDLWVHVVRHGVADEREQFRVARASTLVLGALAIVLGITVSRSERRIHGRARVCHCRQRQLSRAGAVDVLATLLDPRCAGEHAGRHGRGPRADIFFADGPGGHPGQCDGPVSADESGPGHDSAVVRRGHRRVADDTRARFD